MIGSSNLPAARSDALRRQETSRDRRQQAARALQAQRSVWDSQVKAMEIRNETRLTALQADAALALGGHIMEGVVELDKYRRRLAQEDVTTNLLLAEIEAETIQQVKRVQRSLFNDLAF